MAVSITWSETNGGAAISQPLNHGNVENGSSTTEKTIYVRHDGSNPITSCAFYLQQYSGSYNGDSSASADYNELIAWGDDATEDGFGGYLVNMNATGSWASGWATYDAKTPDYGFVCRTGTADTSGNAETLLEEMGLTSGDGEIQTGASPNVRFKCRIDVPTVEDTAGKRQFDLTLKYTYTS